MLVPLLHQLAGHSRMSPSLLPMGSRVPVVTSVHQPACSHQQG